MPRQLLIIAKVCPGVDADLDDAVARMGSAIDLQSLVGPDRTGRGLLHWTCWYDPWLMGNDLEPGHWPLNFAGIKRGDGLWELPLDADWSAVKRAATDKHHHVEQTWLAWQLWHAYQVFVPWNHIARLFYGRRVLGSALSDEELLGEQFSSRSR